MEELIMASEKVTKLIEDVKALTVLELSELVKALEEEFGVSILVVRRGMSKILPTEDFRVIRGDALAVHIINITEWPEETTGE